MAETPNLGKFPFLFGRAFIEASSHTLAPDRNSPTFPFLFGRAFIEALICRRGLDTRENFPSFSEGLSLRLVLAGFSIMLCIFPFLFGRAFIEACVCEEEKQ